MATLKQNATDKNKKMPLIVCRLKVIHTLYYLIIFRRSLMDICKKFGNRVRELRIAQGLSQEVLAQKAGLHRTYIGGIERGERNVSLENIQKIAVALSVNIPLLMNELES